LDARQDHEISISSCTGPLDERDGHSTAICGFPIAAMLAL
jgi:hypothetical protein